MNSKSSPLQMTRLTRGACHRRTNILRYLRASTQGCMHGTLRSSFLDSSVGGATTTVIRLVRLLHALNGGSNFLLLCMRISPSYCTENYNCPRVRVHVACSRQDLQGGSCLGCIHWSHSYSEDTTLIESSFKPFRVLQGFDSTDVAWQLCIVSSIVIIVDPDEPARDQTDPTLQAQPRLAAIP